MGVVFTPTGSRFVRVKPRPAKLSRMICESRVVGYLEIASFPSSQRKGSRDINKNVAKPPYFGADGVARSASPIGRSPNRRPAKFYNCAELTTITASRYRA